MLRVVVACMFSLWEALEDGLEVCITTIRTRLTGFFWHCFDADATGRRSKYYVLKCESYTPQN